MSPRFRFNPHSFSFLLPVSIFVVIYYPIKSGSFLVKGIETAPDTLSTTASQPMTINSEDSPIRVAFPDFINQSGQTIFVEEGRDPGSFLASLTIDDQLDSEWSVSLSDDTFKLLLSYQNAWGLHTASSLDRETRPSYNLSIFAVPRNRSRYKIGQTYTRMIQIELMDVNDNAPIFNSIPDTMQFPAGSVRAGSYITTLNATDVDIGRNGEIAFRLDNYNDLFDIDRALGVVTATRNLYHPARYDIIIRVVDFGTPPLSSVTILSINVVEDRWAFYRIYRYYILTGLTVVALISLAITLICICGHRLFQRWVLQNQLKFSFFPFNSDLNGPDKDNCITDINGSLKLPLGSVSCLYGSPLPVFPCIHFGDTCDSNHLPLYIKGSVLNSSAFCDRFRCDPCNKMATQVHYQVRRFDESTERRQHIAGCLTCRRDERSKLAVKDLSNKRSQSDDGCYCSSDISSDRSDRNKKHQIADGLVVTNAVDPLDGALSKLSCFGRPLQTDTFSACFPKFSSSQRNANNLVFPLANCGRLDLNNQHINLDAGSFV